MPVTSTVSKGSEATGLLQVPAQLTQQTWLLPRPLSLALDPLLAMSSHVIHPCTQGPGVLECLFPLTGIHREHAGCREYLSHHSEALLLTQLSLKLQEQELAHSNLRGSGQHVWDTQEGSV